jgi:outer membrane receptor for ferrienterochelin and colicins
LFTIAARGVYEDRLAAMCVGRKNIVAVTKSMAKAFIPNEKFRKLPTAVSGKTDAVLFRKRTFSRQPIRHDELYCESKIGFLQLTWDKKIEIMTSSGIATRYNYYDDNTPATSKKGPTTPKKPGCQEFYSRRNYIHRKTKAITGNALRLQLDSRKHHITPRIAYKWN